MKKSEYKEILGQPHVSDTATSQELAMRYRLVLNALSNLEKINTDKSVHNDSNYHYIPFPSARFIDILLDGYLVLGADNSKKFLDIGCGIGLTVLLSSTFFDAYGFDYNQELVDKAKLLVGDSAFFDDATTFEHYGEYDFIYFYRPFFNAEQNIAFEQRVFEQMKPGAIVCPIWESFDWPKYTKQVGKYLYRKWTIKI